MNAGIINLSVDFAESYSEELKRNDINVIQLTSDDFEQKISELDAIIIRENPDEDTARTCSILLKLKEKSDAYVWVFSSNTQKLMRTVYLQLGALGVVSEECDESELQLIISNSLNRRSEWLVEKESDAVAASAIDDHEELEDGRIELIPRNFAVKVDGKKEIPLTRLEYKMMEILHANKNNTVTYEELSEEVWSETFKNKTYRIANLIFHLREKIEDNSVNHAVIRTIRSKGYMLVD
ncbi:response regulator transcription factor [Enterococcus sp. BWM-S5]|uniref:Response regulator transcription factor n=1 Tax=Enterococcus larvae TaxID=2794352 RepID=A0ABS4CMG4_9ENTE|nr:winged helix-turn-helix domain-containing protein [Enterococcus larvae]MBP1047683.1 response regulator transcription factor [Enterococcus larvae]